MRTDPLAASPSRPSGVEALERAGTPSRYRVRSAVILSLASLLAVLASVLVLLQGPVVAAAVVAIIAASIAIVLAPQIGFFLYFILAFARPQDVLGGLEGVRLALPVAGLTLAAAIVHQAVRRERPWASHPVTWSVLAFGLIVTASATYNGGDWERWTELAKQMVMALAAASYLTRRSWLAASIAVLTFCIGFLCVEGLVRYDIHVDPHLMGPGQLGARLVDRNYFSMFLLMGIPLYYFGGWATRFWPLRLALWLLIPLTVNAVFLTQSRGGLLGVGVVTIIIALMSRFRVLAVSAGLVLLVGLYFQLAPRNLRERAGTIVNYEGEASAEGRIDSWRAGLTMMIRNPHLGVGPGYYVDSYSQYASTRARQAHSAYVQAGAEYGVLGMLAFIAILFFTLRELLRVRGRSRGDPQMRWWSSALLASFCGYAVCAAFLSAEGFELAYVLAALTVALRTVQNRAAWAATEPPA